jgi:two-component system, NtrC family, sensor histidine kinase HydH
MPRALSWKILKRKGLYLSAITIVMVAVTLVVMHGISTFRTLDLNRRQWEKLLEKNAHDIISTVRAEGLMDRTASPKELRELLDKVVQNTGIAYIGFLDKDHGRIAWSQSARVPSLPLFEGRGWEEGQRETLSEKIKKFPDGTSIFEYKEFLGSSGAQMAVVGLWMTPLEEARRQDIQHAILMGVILLILGSAAFYFIFVIQNYYLVDRTLAEMRSYTENVVESMASGLVTVDTNGGIVSTNRKASRLLGMDTRQVQGRPLESLIPAQYLNINEVIEQEKGILEKEVDCPSGQGGTVPLSVSVTPLKDSEGGNIGAVIILRDLREIRELQEKVRRSERLAALGRLASGVAHEIRNPLSSIKGFTQYFRDKFEVGTEDKSYADIMIQEVERLNRVITQLLDFGRPKELRLDLHPLSQIVEHPLQLIRADLDKRGIKLIESPFPEEKVRVDSDQITQALLNIFLNAMESMESGGELRVGTVKKPERGGVEIWISDSGSGIPQGNLTKIFDPFFSTKKKGTGLGLAITANIIEAHGGEISVESREGKGTTFKIFLPYPKYDTQRERKG